MATEAEIKKSTEVGNGSEREIHTNIVATSECQWHPSHPHSHFRGFSEGGRTP